MVVDVSEFGTAMCIQHFPRDDKLDYKQQQAKVTRVLNRHTRYLRALHQCALQVRYAQVLVQAMTLFVLCACFSSTQRMYVCAYCTVTCSSLGALSPR
jgi:hypothetical protein